MAVIATHEATEIEETSFQANGEVLDMEGESAVYVYFRYWKKADESVEDTPPDDPALVDTTEEQEMLALGTFNASITDLDRWTRYNHRAEMAYPEEIT